MKFHATSSYKIHRMHQSYRWRFARK